MTTKPATDELKWLLAILWLIQAVNYTAYVLILSFEGGAAAAAEAGNSMLLVAIFYFIPCLLAVIAFLASPSVARWAHIVVGAAFVIIKIIGTVGGATGMIGGSDDGISVAVVFNEFWAIFAAAWIVKLAWKDRGQ